MTYMLVGCGGIQSLNKKYAVFKFHEDNPDLEHLGDYLANVNVGQQYADQERGIVYVVDETIHQREQVGGGGSIISLAINKAAGTVSLLNQKPSLGALPSYVFLDRSKRYAVVAHHCTGHFVTKIVHDESRGFITRTQFDDASLVLFRVNEDGSLGEACDAAIPGSSHIPSHLHCVLADPTGELYLICDKGADKIYSYHIDREKGKLVYLSEISVPRGYSPRYGAYHPVLPVFYITNEGRPDILGFHYDNVTGSLKQLYSVPLLPASELSPAGIMPASSDIIIHPEGRCLYAAIRGIDRISVLHLDHYGSPVLMQHIGSGGRNPHGLCISPDGHFLFAANRDSNSICTFAIGSDGSLSLTGSRTDIAEPKNMKLFIAP